MNASEDCLGALYDETPSSADIVTDYFGGAWDIAPASAPPAGAPDGPMLLPFDDCASGFDEAVFGGSARDAQPMSPQDLANFGADLVLRSPRPASGIYASMPATPGPMMRSAGPFGTPHGLHSGLFYAQQRGGSSPGMRSAECRPPPKDNLYMQLQRTQQAQQTALQQQRSVQSMLAGGSPLMMATSPAMGHAARGAAAAAAAAFGGNPYAAAAIAAYAQALGAPQDGDAMLGFGGSASGSPTTSPAAEGPHSPLSADGAAMARLKRARYSPSMVGGAADYNGALMAAAHMGFFPRVSAPGAARTAKLPLKPMARPLPGAAQPAPSEAKAAMPLPPLAPAVHIQRVVQALLSAKKSIMADAVHGGGMRIALKDVIRLDERDRRGVAQFLEETQDLANETITVVELKSLLRRYEVQATGKKAELMQRLYETRRHVLEVAEALSLPRPAPRAPAERRVETSAASSPETISSEVGAVATHADALPPLPSSFSDDPFGADYGLDLSACEQSVFFNT